MIREKKEILTDFAITCQRPASLEEKSFEDRSRVIMSLISKFFDQQILTKGFWKVSMNVNSSNELQHMKVVGGVLRYNVTFDVEGFLNFNLSQQKTKLLEFITVTLQKIFFDSGIDTKLLSGIEKFVVEHNYENYFSGPISKHNGLTAGVLCKQKFDEAEIYLIVGKKKIEERMLILKTAPNEFAFFIYLKKPLWISNEEIELKASNGECYVINLNCNTPDATKNLKAEGNSLRLQQKPE